MAPLAVLSHTIPLLNWVAASGPKNKLEPLVEEFPSNVALVKSQESSTNMAAP